ncbi:MAG: GMP synthase subunit A [Archaeoglobales archaeon]|nr:MAG: GMP synthase subunit A [Archaeoglobales archaeon]
MVKVYVVYNYGQYNHLIHRTLRDLGIESKLVENTTPVEKLTDADGIVLGGGPSLDRTGNCEIYVKELDVPILGVCLGHQLLAKIFGGEVGKGEVGGYAEVIVRIVEDDEIFEGLPRELRVWASHSDEVKKLPENFKLLAESDICKIEAMKHVEKPIYGVQWHPEVYHTERGVDFYRNFIKICKR